jgi:hypothetical protein
MQAGRWSLQWHGLPDDTYYLDIHAADAHSESCCLKGDLLLYFFRAPPQPRFRPGELAYHLTAQSPMTYALRGGLE